MENNQAISLPGLILRERSDRTALYDTPAQDQLPDSWVLSPKQLQSSFFDTYEIRL